MTYASEVLADSPLAYYRLGEASGATMTDSSGNGRSGLYNAGVTLGASGLINDSDTAATFNGSTGSASVVSASWMDVGTAFSVEAWIKMNLGASFREIAARYTGSTNRAWEFRIDSTTGCLNFIKLLNGTTSVVGATNIRDGNTHHVATTYDGSNIRLYVDGALDQIAAASGALTGSTANLKVGERDADFFFPGIIDEVALYGSALSATRLGVHHTAGLTAPPPPTLTGAWGWVA